MDENTNNGTEVPAGGESTPESTPTPEAMPETPAESGDTSAA